MYKNKYIKYKQKYLNLKSQQHNITITPDYTFKYFDNLTEQHQYILDNKERIVALWSTCFPSNFDPKWDVYEEATEGYLKSRYRLVESTAHDRNWYFVLNKDLIIGLCNIEDETVVKIDPDEYKKVTGSELKTYTAIDHFPQSDSLMTEKRIYPVINALCKDQNFKNVGKFLIDNVVKCMKEKKHKVLYLISGSEQYKINSYLYGSKCNFVDKEKYFDSNKKLNNYYKSIGFKESKNLFLYDECHIVKKRSNKFHLYHVMYMNL